MRHASSLDEHHNLGAAGNISASRLSLHLATDHHIAVRVKTQSELGRLHLLAHAIAGYPELFTIMTVVDYLAFVQTHLPKLRERK